MSQPLTWGITTADSSGPHHRALLGGPSRKMIDDIDSPPAFSPDGHKIAFFRGNTAKAVMELHVADADGSSDRTLTTRPFSQQFSNYGLAWSADGKTIYTGAYDERSKAFIIGVSFPNGEQRILSPPLWTFIGRVNLLRDGQTLVFSVTTPQNQYSPKVIQFSPASGRWSVIVSDLASYEHAQSAGSDLVAVQQSRLSSVWIAPASFPTSARRITPPAGHLDNLVWSPDKTLIASIQEGSEEHLWRLSLDGAVQQLTRGAFIDLNPTVEPTSGAIAFTSNRGSGWTLWTIDKNGNGLRPLTEGDGVIWNAPSFAPNGSILVGTQSNGHSRIFKMSRLGEAPQPLLDVDALSPVVSRRGDLMACAIQDRISNMIWQIAVIDLFTLQKIKRFPNIPVLPNPTVRWLPDGSALTYPKEENGISNIWKTSIATGAQEQLTHFNEEKIFSFDWSPDASDLAMIRGIAASDVLLVRGHL